MVHEVGPMSGDDLELQDNNLVENNTNTDPLLTVPSPDSPIKQQFYRMSEYFNILDRVFHYKRMNNGNGESSNNSASSSNDHSYTPPSNNNSIVDANDGVFSNLSAKPESSFDRRERLLQLFHEQLQQQETHVQTGDQLFTTSSEQGNTGVVYSPQFDNVYNINQLYEHLAGSTSQQPHTNRIDDGEIERIDKPPSYEEAHNDTVPSYWDLSPEGSLYYDEVCVNGLPAGSLINFVWNCIVSSSFQFFGFLITYILHTSHAAKEGSRCGLGITFISLGLKTMPNNVSNKVGKGKEIPRL